MYRVLIVSRRFGKRRMMLDKLWENLIRQHAEELRKPGSIAPGVHPEIVAAKMAATVRESFAKGDKHDWLKHNPALARAVKACFGYTTTKQWREAWQHLS